MSSLGDPICALSVKSVVQKVWLLFALVAACFAPSRLRASMDVLHLPGVGSPANGALSYQAAYTAFGEHNPNVPTSANVPGMPPNSMAVQGYGAEEWTATGALTDHFRKNTKEESDSGLINEGQRYFDPEMGRFLTADPLGLADGTNPYTYVHQNPWTKFDPEGLYFMEMVPAWAQSLVPDTLKQADRGIDIGREAAGVYKLSRETGGGMAGSLVEASGVAITRTTGAMDWAEAVNGEEIVNQKGQITTQPITDLGQEFTKAVGGAAGMVLTGAGGAKVIGPAMAESKAASTEAVAVFNKENSAPPAPPSAPATMSPAASDADSAALHTVDFGSAEDAPSMQQQPRQQQMMQQQQMTNAGRRVTVARELKIQPNKSHAAGDNLTHDEAVETVQSGGDVVAKDRTTARAIAKDAGNGDPVHHDPHDDGQLPHYHSTVDGEKQSSHVAY